ncbi:hypothetical protein D9M71_250370 [compost metagenome]
MALHLGHFHAGTHRRVEFSGIGFEVLGNLIFRCKGIGVQAVEGQAREAVVPGRAVGHQRIPTAGAPGFGDTVFLQDQVRHTEPAQVFTHGHAGLTGADNKRVYLYFFHCHVRALPIGGEEGVGRILFADMD